AVEPRAAAAPPAAPDRLVRPVGSALRRRRRPVRAGGGARDAAVRLRRAPPEEALPGGGGRLRRGRQLRQQGVPLQGDGVAGGRGGDGHRRRHWRRAPRRPGRGRRPRAHRPPRQQQVDRRAVDGAGGRRRAHRGRQPRRARPAGGPRGRRGEGPAGPAPGDPRGRGPHPRVRADRSGRLEVRLHPLHRGRCDGRGPGDSLPGGRPRRGPRPHREQRVRALQLRPRRRGAGRLRRPPRPARAVPRRRARCGLRGGRGDAVHHGVGGCAPSCLRRRRHHGPPRGRAWTLDRGRGRRHPVHRRDGEGGGRGADLPGGRRGHERQPPTRPLRQRLRDLPPPGRRCGSSVRSPRRRQALRVRRPDRARRRPAGGRGGRRRARHAGHRGLRALDGLQLQQGPEACGGVRRRRRGPPGRAARDARRPPPPRPV
ncbi:MAG: Diaminopimelate decarboxylase, partial [uncultured Acidimicrobiales bacterium]